MMRFRSQGLPWITGTGLPAIIFYAGWLVYDHFLLLAGFVVFTLLTVFLIYFFRDPHRQPASDDASAWLAPADGVVTKIEELDSGRRRIVIFLTIFNVHINRMPVDGVIEEILYRPGSFLPAYREKLHEKNERNIIRCRDGQGREFEVWQIAGLLARRIYSWLEEGTNFKRGQQFGMIALSSRTDLVIPGDVIPEIEIGDTVRAGQTVVARG